MKKLSPSQYRILHYMNEALRCFHKIPDTNWYVWTSGGNMNIATPTANALIKHGLIETKEDGRYYISDAGIAALTTSSNE